MIYPTYATKLGFYARKINVGVYKINGFDLDIFEIVIVEHLVKNKLEKVWFFQKAFLLANISLEIVLRIHFLSLSKANIRFTEQKLVLRIYIAAETLSMIKRVKIINKWEFAVAALNADDKTFMVHVVALAKWTTMLIYSSYQVQVALLKSEKNGILTECSNFSNVFSSDSAAKIPEYTRINDHSINLLYNKQPIYYPIYRLRLVELKIMKTYIEINLVGGFIRPLKCPSFIPILFVGKKIVVSAYA